MEHDEEALPAWTMGYMLRSQDQIKIREDKLPFSRQNVYSDSGIS
jgi:hypothetical protein